MNQGTDHLEAIRTESARFSQVAHQLDLATPVPSCPDWSSADLVHHLAEVQDFWSQVVRGADGEDATDLPRPADDAALPDAYDAASGRLVAALEQADPTGSCWSWHEDGHSIAWALRRQAHQVLVHRVDAELAAGKPRPAAGRGDRRPGRAAGRDLPVDSRGRHAVTPAWSRIGRAASAAAGSPGRRTTS